MTVNNARGRHRRPKRRLARTMAAALLIVLLTGVPASVSTPAGIDQPAARTTIEER